jgi:hypothetical protein
MDYDNTKLTFINNLFELVKLDCAKNKKGGAKQESHNRWNQKFIDWGLPGQIST